MKFNRSHWLTYPMVIHPKMILGLPVDVRRGIFDYTFCETDIMKALGGSVKVNGIQMRELKLRD